MVNRSAESLERSRAASREAKRRRRGRCVDCGRETSYDGRGGVSARCHLCAPAARGLKVRGTGRRQRLVLELLAERGSARFSEIAEATGTRIEAMSQLMGRLVANGLVERAGRGVYRLPGGDS